MPIRISKGEKRKKARKKEKRKKKRKKICKNKKERKKKSCNYSYFAHYENFKYLNGTLDRHGWLWYIFFKKKERKETKLLRIKQKLSSQFAAYFLEKNRQKSKNLANQSCKFNALQLSQLRQSTPCNKLIKRTFPITQPTWISFHFAIMTRSCCALFTWQKLNKSW